MQRTAIMAIIMILPLMTALATSASGQQQYTFRLNIPSDQRISFDRWRETMMKTDNILDGKSVSSSMDYAIEHLSGQAHVLESIDGEPTACRYSFDPACSVKTRASPEAAWDSALSPFAAYTITLRRVAPNKVEDDFKGDIDDDTRDDLHGFLDPDSLNYPDHPVVVGDTWDCSDKVATHTPLAPGDKMLEYCRLDWVKTINGRPTAQLTLSGAVVRHAGDVTTTDTIGGTMLIDMRNGMVFQYELTGKTEMHGKEPLGAGIEARSAAMSGTGTFYERGSSTLVGATTQPTGNRN